MNVKEIAKRMASGRAKTGGGDFFSDGTGVVIISALKNQEGKEGAAFIAELKVHASTSFDGAKTKANAVGSTVSYIQNFSKYPDTAYSNAEDFILKAIGETRETLAASSVVTKAELVKQGKLKESDSYDGSDEYAAAYEKFCSSDQPLRGKKVGYSTYRKMNRKGTVDMVLLNFTYIEETAEEIAATRRSLETVEIK